METAMPEAFKELTRIYTLLEKHYRDMQDMEFHGRAGQAVDAADPRRQAHCEGSTADRRRTRNEGLISKKDAVSRIDPASPRSIAASDHRSLRDARCHRHRPAGVAGRRLRRIVFSSDEAAKLQADGRNVILVRIETSPEDIHGMHAAEGILTTRGGMTSHAAVVRARHGQALRLRLRQHPRRLPARHHDASGRAPSRPATSSPSTDRWARCWPGGCR